MPLYGKMGDMNILLHKYVRSLAVYVYVTFLDLILLRVPSLLIMFSPLKFMGLNIGIGVVSHA